MLFSEVSGTLARSGPTKHRVFNQRRGDGPPAFRVHVVGCPRSGTTLITELLRYAYKFHGIARHEESLFAPTGDIKYPYLSKKPSDTTRIARLLDADPDLYVIAIYRDPRSVVTSKHSASPSDDYYVDFPRWRAAMTAIERLALAPRCLTIRYESLVAYPADVQRHIEAKLRFLVRRRSFNDFPAGASDVPTASLAALNGIRSFDPMRLRGWQLHLPKLRYELEQNPDLPKWLIRLGYEDDLTWTDQLKEVTPAGGSQKSHRKPGWHSIEIALRYWWRSRRYLAERKKYRRCSNTRTTGR